MSEFIKPDTIDAEIILDPNKIIMSKTDKNGIFEFANEYFMEVTGYQEYELMGKSMFCVQHPEMPEVLFKMMWEKLLKQENFQLVVKNLAKSGKYYWSVTNFTFKTDDQNEIVAIYSKRKAATRDSVSYFDKLYKTLAAIEKTSGIMAAEKFAEGYLEERDMNYFSELTAQFYDQKTADDSFNKTPVDIETVIASSKVISTKPITNIIPEGDISIELDDKPISSITSNLPTKIKPETEIISESIQTVNIEKEAEVIESSIEEVILEKEAESNESNSLEETKKGFFQRMFGKTEEEIKAEKKRNTKK